MLWPYRRRAARVRAVLYHVNSTFDVWYETGPRSMANTRRRRRRWNDAHIRVARGRTVMGRAQRANRQRIAGGLRTWPSVVRCKAIFRTLCLRTMWPLLVRAVKASSRCCGEPTAGRLSSPRGAYLGRSRFYPTRARHGTFLAGAPARSASAFYRYRASDDEHTASDRPISVRLEHLNMLVFASGPGSYVRIWPR